MGKGACNWAVLLVGPALLVYCNVSAAGAATGTPEPSGTSATAGSAAGGLRIEATGTPVHAARGARVGYTVQAHNTGRHSIDAAVRLEDLSPGLAIAAADSDPGCLVQRSGYVCTRQALDPGATASWTVYGDIDDAASGSVRAAFAQFAAETVGEPGGGGSGRGVAHGTAEVTTIVDASLPIASPSPSAAPSAPPDTGTPQPPTASPSTPAAAAPPAPAKEAAKSGTRMLPLTGDTALGLIALAFGLLIAGATLRMLFGSRHR